MKITELGGEFREALDLATNHAFTRMIQHCEVTGEEAEVTVLTHIEGLSKGEMKLTVQFFKEGRTTFFHQTPLTDQKAQTLGWNVYLLERTTAARQAVSSANTKLMMLDLSAT